MTTRLVSIGAGVLMIAGSAQAASVSLGNLTVYNSPLTFVNFNAPAGGPFVKFIYTTNWSYGYGGATSGQAAWNIGMPINSVISGFSSVTGTANNGNPTTITISGTFTAPIATATALQFYGSQNPNNFGQFNTNAFWSNTTVSLFISKPPPPTPVGIQYMGVIHADSGQLMTISTTGSTFSPSVGLYDTDGYLLGTNEDPGTGVPGTAIDQVVLRPGPYYIYVAGEGATLGAEDLDVSVPPDAAGGDLDGGINGVAWPDVAIAQGEGRWYGFTVAAPACAGDIDGDGATNAADFTVLAGNFGKGVFPYTSGDLNGDGLVNAADFTILAGDFGCTG